MNQPTFDFVGGGCPDLGLDVFEEALEGRYQVVFGDLRAHRLLEL